MRWMRVENKYMDMDRILFWSYSKGFPDDPDKITAEITFEGGIDIDIDFDSIMEAEEVIMGNLEEQE